jgi:outer membrane lipoprotein carrier protein
VNDISVTSHGAGAEYRARRQGRGGFARVVLVTAIMLLAIAAAAGADATASSAAARIKPIVARLQRHYQTLASFSAKFNERITRPGMPPRERTGRVFYRKPGRMRWEFAAPQIETIVSDGVTLYDYDPGLNQVIETPLEKAFKSNGAAAFVLGVGNLERDFRAAPVASAPADGLNHVVLRPKAGGDPIELGLDPQTANIVTLTLTDGLGNTTFLRFSEISGNPALAPSLFAFTPPAGADIVSSQGAH